MQKIMDIDVGSSSIDVRDRGGSDGKVQVLMHAAGISVSLDGPKIMVRPPEVLPTHAGAKRRAPACNSPPHKWYLPTSDRDSAGFSWRPVLSAAVWALVTVSEAWDAVS